MAEADGFEVGELREVAAWGDLVCLLLPDQVHWGVFAEYIQPALTAGNALLVAHGFSLCYRQVVPPPRVDTLLVAPVGPGQVMRQLYQRGQGIPAVFAIAEGSSEGARPLALAYAKALGCARAGVLESTVREETETDLFGEQAILCGAIPALMKAGFDTLVRNGYQPEVAYFECVHQVKLIVDLIYEGGFAAMRSKISDTAEYGADLAGPVVIDDHVRGSLQSVLNGIQVGQFARQWIEEAAAGAPALERRREQTQGEQVDEVGRRLRRMMPWLRD